MRWSSAEIGVATGGTAHGGEASGMVRTDSRSDLAGAWFLALVGERFDGHAFAVEAASRGAIGGIFSSEVAGWTLPWVEVRDTTEALQDLGRAARRRLCQPVVGVTGSSGKTTTRGLIACALSQLGPVHQTTGNLNNQLGVPMTLLATPEQAAAVVVEMGTSSPGEIRFLAELARPTARLIVNVGPAHLQELGGLAGVAREKGALFATASPSDVVAINVDDPYLAVMRPPGRIVTWGCAEGADIRLIEASIDADSLATEARFATPQGELRTRISVPGVFIAHDAAGALAIAHGLGLDLRRAASDLGGFQPVGMRLKALTLPGGVRAINDAYNANPGSMRASLDMFAALPGRKVVVLGDMLELGADERALHQEIAAYAAGLGFDQVLLCGPRMGRTTVPGARQAEDGVSFVPELVAWLRAGDRVLFKGSRGARVERVLDALTAALQEAACSTT